MVSDLERILGAEIQRERYIPGTRPGQGATTRYIELQSGKPPAVLHRVIRAVDPTIPRSGAVITEPCVLTLPDGTRRFAVSYHGDVVGWQRQITIGAETLDIAVARVEGETLRLSDGRRYPLSDCQAQLG